MGKGEGGRYGRGRVGKRGEVRQVGLGIEDEGEQMRMGRRGSRGEGRAGRERGGEEGGGGEVTQQVKAARARWTTLSQHWRHQYHFTPS